MAVSADDVLLHYENVISKIVVGFIAEFKSRSIVVVHDNRCAVLDIWTQLQTKKIVNK